ncbi:MAG: hypothetical protein H0V89_03500, partial [Deltaproteobacteria bacterium]|nr:hypothetical protein [Deltaproteobacteria bacterium]
MSGLILAACLALHATADEPVEAPPVEHAADPVESFRLELEDAKALWFRGEGDLARDKLRRLYFRAVSGEPVPLELSGECVIYLGEIEIERGSVEGAELVWRWLLQRDPTFPISPYHHSLEVIAQFELVRQRVVDELPLAPPPEIPRYPTWGYAPFGIPQLRQGKPVRGVLYLGGQALTAGASVGVFLHLVLANPEPGLFP